MEERVGKKVIRSPVTGGVLEEQGSTGRYRLRRTVGS